MVFSWNCWGEMGAKRMNWKGGSTAGGCIWCINRHFSKNSWRVFAVRNLIVLFVSNDSFIGHE